MRGVSVPSRRRGWVSGPVFQIPGLHKSDDAEYLDVYRVYKKISILDKSLNYNIKLKSDNFRTIKKLIEKKKNFLFELPNNTVYYPYSYCPINFLHGVLETRIRNTTFVYQCGICNSIIIPRRY